MGQALQEETEVIWCYCCERFQPHVVFPDDDITYYECDVCGCTINDEDDMIARPDIAK